ncbi:PaaI family thioesterase [Limobrevibacterium gyesilva]|uniref:PaaI family thioesterase n=1 Tax=Limobrevibacterium gyesilva TaxID=2991712 RepID=A0AA41YKX1_9PROT|nr:PaaI family thioesterase [Limobrevibacterium gyesilva]MCW3474112.1 PaaI family thioesterase [Limobrevibacterium gyesilva]
MFPPRNPDFAEAVARSFASQGALRVIGAELAVIEPGLCRIRVPYSDAVTQQHGFFHGGVIATVADVAGGYAAMSLCEAGWEVLTVEYKINFVAPASGVAILASGEVVRSGRTLLVTKMDVAAIAADGTQKICAVA